MALQKACVGGLVLPGCKALQKLAIRKEFVGTGHSEIADIPQDRACAFASHSFGLQGDFPNLLI
jgi:hypothetical protein